ncbi:ATP-binding protein [candidate division CSSED10-310 bacterium]|uniref:histidine kinase n=1 Tax=candidate division CSSED10-310 bacterium TaxID=2855610 RepID=A0ABV6Z2D3_UNCC1
METIEIITIIDDPELHQEIKSILTRFISDGFTLVSFSSVQKAEQSMQSLMEEDLENFGILIFNYYPDRVLETKFENIYNQFLPYCKKIALLEKSYSNDILNFTDTITLDKFHFHPLDQQKLVSQIEQLIEKYLEQRILRRSLNDIRETYERMKVQLQTIKEANLKLDKKIMELSTLSEIGRNLMSTYNPEEIYRETVLTLMGQKGASTGILLLFNDEEEVFEVEFHRGYSSDNKNLDLAIKIDSPLMNSIFSSPKAQFIDTMDFPDHHLPELENILNLDVQIVIPLFSKGERKGIILLGSSIMGREYVEDDFEFFSVLANQTVFAIENAQLYAKLQSKIIELERANKELRQLDKMKSEFITIASHELRTPLTAIRGYAELLLSGKFDILSKTQHKAIEVMNKNIDRLIHISDDVVQLSKIDANRISLTLVPTAIEKIVRDTGDDLRPFAQSRNQSLHIEVEDNCPVILVDPELIHQAIAEIIKNAIRFTPDGGKIWVKASQVLAEDIEPEHLPSYHLGSFVQISVKDDGIGVPPNEYQHIFERFYEVQHSDFHHSGTFGFKSGGTGLGLAIVKGIIEKHGGKIWVKSDFENDSQGSEFTFIIPTPAFT